MAAVAMSPARAVPPEGAASASASASVLASASASASASGSASENPADWGPQGRVLPPSMDATNSCVTCHATLTDQKLRAPAKEFVTSVHRDDRIGCAGCHHGDPRDPTVGAHKSEGFLAHPTHAEIPGVCGSCHSDAGFMRHLNSRLPVGQAALYNLSLHGKLTAAGDESAPACADCHGKHDILGPSSPKSPVNRANVATLCGGCHADGKRMAKYGLRTDQAPKWEKSVHGQAFKRGNPNAPTCTGCHGAHAATPPEASSVGRACGRCHEEELAYFDMGPHSKGFRKRGLAECVACHSNHDVQPASSLMVGITPDSTCMKCHSKDEKPRKIAEEIAGLLRGARGRAAEARAFVARAREEGLHVAGASFALDQIATAELKLRGVVHTLDPARLEGPVAAVDKAVGEARKLVEDAAQTRRVERRGYYVALGIACVLFASLALKSLQLDRRRRGRS
jgi:hypothetical protein